MNQIIEKKGKKSADIWELEGGKVALPPSNKGEQGSFRDDKGCNWILNGINIVRYRLNIGHVSSNLMIFKY